MEFLPETLENYLISAQNIRKVLNWYEYYSKSIVFVNKTFGNNVILAPEHSKGIWFWPRLFEKYRNSTLNIRKVSYFYPKHGKRYLLKTLESVVSWPETFRTLVVTLQKIWEKVKRFDQTVLNNSATVECFRIFLRGSS